LTFKYKLYPDNKIQLTLLLLLLITLTHLLEKMNATTFFQHGTNWIIICLCY